MDRNNAGSSQFYPRRKYKLIFQFISAVFIPVLLAVFTVIYTLQQQSIAKSNREVDLRIAAEEHQQNIDLAIDEQRNTQLVTYIREVSDLLLANNFSLNEQILRSVVRPKTLNTLRQLDPIRKSYLVRFLHESQLIPTVNSTFLSLATADLTHIQIGSLTEAIIRLDYSVFQGSYLDNSSFALVYFNYGDFRFTTLRGATFQQCSFNYVQFNTAILQNVSFSVSHVYGADFTNANMLNAKISQKQLNDAGSISKAILPDGSIGRNPNLFIDPNCEKFVNESRIQQNVNISRYQEWMIQVRRTNPLVYYFTGWFDKRNVLRVNFTEFNQDGIVMQKYCFGNEDFITNVNKTELCYFRKWTFPPDPPSNYTSQYKYITEKVFSHRETYMINVDIVLGEQGTCRDVHFSIETV